MSSTTTPLTTRSARMALLRGGCGTRAADLLAVVFAAALLAAGLSTAASAGYYVDPAVLHIGSGQGTACVTGGCPIYNGEVNATGTGHFDVYYNQANGPALDTSVLAIFAVPNGGSLPANAVDSVLLFSNFSTSSHAGGTPVTSVVGPGGYNLTYADQATGLVGSMSSGNVYDFLSAAAGGSGTTFGDLFHAGDNSVSFTNLHAADLAVNGIDASAFSIYIRGLDTTAFSGQSVLDVSFQGVPKGTFVVGFGYQGSPMSNPNPFDTAFTEAGLTRTAPVPSPEPGSIGLLGFGLAALGWLLARRQATRG